MRRVVVIGSGGSGKSTFSRRLGEVTGLPVVHLDRLYWKPGWQPTPKEEWEKTVLREAAKPEWIMDGNFGGTRFMRMQAADTIVMLDAPRLRCLYRVIKRRISHRGRNRPDMGEGCKEKLDLEFILWVWNYPSAGRHRAFDEISKLRDKRVVILKNDKEINEFLAKAYADQKR